MGLGRWPSNKPEMWHLDEPGGWTSPGRAPKVRTIIGVGMAGYRHPSLRTGLADFPHPALRLVTPQRRLDRLGTGCGQREQPVLHEVSVWP